MMVRGKIGAALRVVLALTLGVALAYIAPDARAQTKEPIKIGFSMALSGGLSPNGKAALLAMQIWEADQNAKGGLLGRPVKLVYYDDQTDASTVPGIYTKLLDVDKVDLVVGPYGTNICDYDAPTNNATGYHYVCLSANAQGGALIAVGAGGVASQLDRRLRTMQ